MKTRKARYKDTGERDKDVKTSYEDLIVGNKDMTAYLSSLKFPFHDFYDQLILKQLKYSRCEVTTAGIFN